MMRKGITYQLSRGLQLNKLLYLKKVIIIFLMLLCNLSCSAQIDRELRVLSDFFNQITELVPDNFPVQVVNRNGKIGGAIITSDSTSKYVLFVSDVLVRFYSSLDSTQKARYLRAWEKRKLKYPEYPVDSFMLSQKGTIHYELGNLKIPENLIIEN